MAYQDALFQLGMDLTRSSTAQKEDHGETARLTRDVESVSKLKAVRQEAGIDRFQDRVAAGIAGSHLIIDLFGARRLDDAEHIERTLRRCAGIAGAAVRHVQLDSGLPAEGVSGFAALTGGHIAIHTHPLTGCAALDIFLRGAVDVSPAVSVLEEAFVPARMAVKEELRGAQQRAGSVASVGPSARARSKVRKAA